MLIAFKTSTVFVPISFLRVSAREINLQAKEIQVTNERNLQTDREQYWRCERLAMKEAVE